ncbi:MAG: hypothetical protein Q7J16_13315 [Candidatus Cloacimonadales bacterium]|nr:hypothetical protein [Candidatus Cloacimonadales bacterium]
MFGKGLKTDSKRLKKLLSSNKGFGLVQVVATLLMVSIAVAGLFISSYIARHQAINNYHYRCALLKGLEVFERLRWGNRFNSGPVSIQYQQFKIPFGRYIMEEEEGRPVYLFVESLVKRTSTDLTISQYVSYDEVTLKITWKDGPDVYESNTLNREKELVLREDYFYRPTLSGP